MYDEELEKLKIEHLIFPFSLLVVGLLISLVVFLAEQCWANSQVYIEWTMPGIAKEIDC